jgi:E3 ubiquitin-protein ligase Arkadia
MAMDIENMSYEQLLELEERMGDVVLPGLGDDAIQGLPTERVCGGGGECAICLGDVCDGDTLVTLPCLHKFHAQCCGDWLKRQAKCPLCNFGLKA